jgi:hypothetical protein
MAKAFRKTLARKQARQAAWDNRFGKKQGFKRPGSNKKDYPYQSR